MGHPDALANARADGYAYADARNPNPDGYRQPYADGYDYPNPDGYTHAIADSYANAYAVAHARNADRQPHADASRRMRRPRPRSQQPPLRPFAADCDAHAHRQDNRS